MSTMPQAVNRSTNVAKGWHAAYGSYPWLMIEFPEFGRTVLEALRQPLEDSEITVSRVQNTITFPAECILIAAMNPCPCGFKGLPEERCIGQSQCERYNGRISGPCGTASTSTSKFLA